MDEDAYFEAVEKEGPDYVADIPRPGAYEMTRSDYFVSELCDFLQTYTVLILSMAGSSGAVFLFYRNKLKIPIEELAQASQKIAGNHLDFRIAYENQDEMGMLCKEFERMREQLARNNQILWRTIEEERMLRAAIAHDIRAPLLNPQQDWIRKNASASGIFWLIFQKDVPFYFPPMWWKTWRQPAISLQ